MEAIFSSFFLSICIFCGLYDAAARMNDAEALKFEVRYISRKKSNSNKPDFVNVQ